MLERHRKLSTSDHANVAIMPPLLFAGALALGCLLSATIPIGPGLGAANALALFAGFGFAVIGFGIVALSLRAFARADTPVQPDRPSSALVTDGPYRLTRNPIYIGFVLAYFGLAIMLTSMWVLLLLVPVIAILQRGVIEREEAYLQERFGDAYRAYQARVPRWL